MIIILFLFIIIAYILSRYGLQFEFIDTNDENGKECRALIMWYYKNFDDSCREYKIIHRFYKK